jgi:hypothetical protein
MFFFPSSKMYVGEWRSGYQHGKGVYSWPDGKVYDGEYRKGEKHGYGTMTYPDKSKYYGGWKHNKRHGRGVEQDTDGSVRHCGQWEKDKPVFAPAKSPKRQQNSGQPTREKLNATLPF